MTDNEATNRTVEYQQRQLAKGLCRACPQPISPHSTRLCEFHLNKQREYSRVHRGVPIGDYFSHKQSHVRAQEVATYALANPPVTLRELSDKFGMSNSGIYNALRRCGVYSGWMKS